MDDAVPEWKDVLQLLPLSTLETQEARKVYYAEQLAKYQRMKGPQSKRRATRRRSRLVSGATRRPLLPLLPRRLLS